MRTKPYTARGISRCKCMKCGKPAVHQWSACAVNHKHMPICLDCDIELNRLALTFILGRKKAIPIVNRYERKERAS